MLTFFPQPVGWRLVVCCGGRQPAASSLPTPASDAAGACTVGGVEAHNGAQLVYPPAQVAGEDRRDLGQGALGVLANGPGSLGEQQLHRQGKGAGLAGCEEQRRQRKPRRQLVAPGVEAVTTAAREPALCGACCRASVCYV